MWQSCTERYCPENDSIDLVDSKGEIIVRLHRNAIIRMIGMLPSEPPAESLTEEIDQPKREHL